MVFVRDITIGEGESVPPSTRFLKTWRLQNCGAESWPDGCTLRHLGGDIAADKETVIVKCVEPLEMVDVSVEMTSPSVKGIYQSRWHMNTPNGIPFGGKLLISSFTKKSETVSNKLQSFSFRNYLVYNCCG